MKRRPFVSWLLVAALLVPLPTAFAQNDAAQAAAPHGNVDAITADQMRAYLSYIASDEMEGRNTPSRGLDLTAKFIATLLTRWGVQPAGDNGTYFQKIPLRREIIDAAKSSVELNGKRFAFGDGFLAQPVSGSVSGNLIYVGHGWVLPSKKINAYELADGTKLDVKDKIVIAASGLPKAIPVGDVVNGKVGVDYETPASYAAKNGAKAVIFIPAERTLARWSRLRESAVKGGSFQMVRTGQDVSRIPAITASESLLKALFDGEKASGSDILKKAADEPIAGFELTQKKTVAINVSGQAEQVMTQNVVAKIEGSDPTLKSEYVAFGAHYDHVGVGAPDKNGDTIYNGADDNGSGTTAILSLAEAIATGPRPKRSFLFVWHCGEEKGLWGSEYFTDHPTVPLDKIVTQINIDMIGRSRPPGDKNSRNDRLTGPDEIYVIGSKMMSTELGQITEQANASYLKLKLNYKYDDPKDTERLFFRSDHFNYAQHGVPIIFYFDGVHEDYHRPSDEVSKIDFAKMEKVTRTVLATAWEVANRAERVKVDKKLPDELTRR